MKLLRQELNLLLALVLFALGLVLEHRLLAGPLPYALISIVVILGIIVAVSFRVAHHAEVLAQRFGEPYGTMILTLSAVLVEVLVLVILMLGTHSPTLARDTIFAAVMIDINGIIGIAAMIGGFKHGEQKYNLDASNSYIAMLLVAMGIAMFVPDFITPVAYTGYTLFTIVITILLYTLFLRIQTVEHRYFFQYGRTKLNHTDQPSVEPHYPSWLHVLLLVGSIAIIGLLSELLSVYLDHTGKQVNIPVPVTAMLVALISASPEILTAVRAAIKDQMQTVINIALGASLATVLLTVPIILGLSLAMGFDIKMGLTPLQSAMLLLTLLAAMINLHDGESNALEGAVHFALFLTFITLAFVIA